MGEFVPIAVPDLSGNERKYLNECVDSNFVSTIGPFVDRFESDIARATGAAYAVATTTGTAGLHLGLLAVGVEPGDLVIVPSLSFIATANAVSYCGAEPWFLDVDRTSWTLDASLVTAALSQETEMGPAGRRIHRDSGRPVSAIMPVYTLGVPADMDPIVATAKEFDLPVVADAAPAVGALYRQRPLGRLGTDFTVFSFNGNKTITAGGGGAVISSDPILIDRVRHLSTTARNGPNYDHDEVGFNYRMTNIQAAVGCAQLERLDELLAAKQALRNAYDVAIRKISGLEPFPRPEWSDGSAWLSGFSVDPPNPAHADAILNSMRHKRIDARPVWRPIHLQTPYLQAPRGPLAICESIWTSIVTLPSSSSIEAVELERVIEALATATANI